MGKCLAEPGPISSYTLYNTITRCRAQLLDSIKKILTEKVNTLQSSGPVYFWCIRQQGAAICIVLRSVYSSLYVWAGSELQISEILGGPQPWCCHAASEGLSLNRQLKNWKTAGDVDTAPPNTGPFTSPEMCSLCSKFDIFINVDEDKQQLVCCGCLGSLLRFKYNSPRNLFLIHLEIWGCLMYEMAFKWLMLTHSWAVLRKEVWSLAHPLTCVIMRILYQQQ